MYSRRWLIAAVLACVLASACSQFNTNLSIQTASSTLTFVSPSTATIGSIPSTGLQITATGTGFVSTGTYILWNAYQANQIQLTNTVYVSATQLTAVVPQSAFTTSGVVQIAIQIPGSAVSGSSNINATTTTEISNIVNFTVNPTAGPSPTVSSLSAPSSSMPSTPYCSPNGFTLTVNGTNFASGAVVNWTSAANGSANGATRATNFVNPTQLTASILPTDIAFPGIAGVSVSTATGTSNTMPFTLTTPTTTLPAPSISSISQNLVVNGVSVGTSTSVPAGSAPTSFPLTVNGSSFVPCSVVQFAGSAEPTTYVSANQLVATIPPAAVSTAGPGNTATNVNVTVFTIAPGGGTSPPSIFTITPSQ